MSETTLQETAPAQVNVRGRWEWFWRIIAGLMLVTIGWVAWVAYQIMPRSVVTPLAYASQDKQIATQATAPASTQPAPAAADLAMAEAQAALRDGAHQASADVQAAALAKVEQAVRGEGLKLSTEITTPLAERQSPRKNEQDSSPGTAPSAPAATDRTRNVR